MSGIAQFLVGDKTGRIIAELEPDVGPVSWRLNDIGRCQFSLARTDSKATETNLRYGNRVLIKFDNGLPDWGGIIDTPRTWEKGIITCNAYSGEYVLTWRQTDIGRYFDDATVGAIFESVINDANTQQALGLNIGAVWSGGESHSPDYHFGNLFDIVQDSICTRLSNADFDVTVSEVDGKITLTANLYERKGADKTNVALMEGHNLVDSTRLNEQGSIINWWDMVGAGDGWGPDRMVSNSQDATSQIAYGLRQGGRIYSDVSKQGTLDAHATNALAESKDPYKVIELEASNLAPAGFNSYGVGDSVRVILPSFGFGGTDEQVRILAREFDPKNGTCGLVVRIDE